MADKKISALTSATTPLAGTEVLPVVQSGSTTKVSVANLTAGRSIDTAGASLDGAVVINDSGANVDFRVKSDTKANALFVKGSDGFVGINNDAPIRPLVVRTEVGGDPTYGGDVVINSSGGASGINSTGGIELKQDNSGNGFGARFFQYFDGLDGYNTAIQYRSNSASWATPFVINKNGNFTLANDVTVSTGNLVIGTSGKGIDFSASTDTGTGTVTGQTLTDYEEGTWTPSLTRSDQTGFTYTAGASDAATYTRIGRQVFVRAIINGTFSGGAGAYRITGLPFAPSGGNNSWFAALILDGSAGTSGAGMTYSTDQIYFLDITPISGNILSATVTYQV